MVRWWKGTGGRPEREWGGDLCDGLEAEGPGEGVTLSLSVYLFLSPSLPVSHPVPSHSCDCRGLRVWGPAGPEREVVVNMLNSLSRNQPLPQIASRCGCADPLPSRLPYQGYESACSGRHYCLRGMDYCVTGAPYNECRQRPLYPVQPTVRSVLPYDHRPGMQCVVITPPPPYYPCPNLRWDTSHFKKTGAAQRNSYVVHPEFVSETF
ncbi:ciliated bronchial epithelium 1 [Phyllostomus discolor]|uniref:Ciliated bronchial epithelium 1 n=1 Tax=Phyllostomus discolor TaxID=89673 RepID=A0A834B950_9CHIR|nr:ciliated bronchial epithelium 1 [Phyllostomus discolor]